MGVEAISSLEPTILHCDLNNFYASVACMLDPELRGKPVAVCGDPAHRHGIVLAKSQEARAFGVRTGDVLWEARQKCPGLIPVLPDFPTYLRISREIQALYSEYTDQLEPFGIDECWLDVTGSRRLFGDGVQIAAELRRRVRERGLTISVGVSFNKIFAKLGSDLKKPDATTCITPANYQSLLWPLPAEELLMVGRSTKRKLNQYGIYTIGDLALSSEAALTRLLGSNGRKLRRYARGEDDSPVLRAEEQPRAKSIGQGITCTQDLRTSPEIRQIIHFLAQRVSRRLREAKVLAGSFSLYLRRSDLKDLRHQLHFPSPCRSSQELAAAAWELLETYYDWKLPIRAVRLQAGDLQPEQQCCQQAFWSPWQPLERQERLEAVTDQLRRRFGPGSICRASLLGRMAVPEIYQGDYSVLPGSRV